MKRGLTLCFAFALTLDTAAILAATTIVVDNAKQNDAGLSLAIGDLEHALKAEVVYLDPGAKLPPGNIVVVGRRAAVPGESFTPPVPEAYRIKPFEYSGGRGIVVEGDERGLMYGTFKLARRIQIGDDPWSMQFDAAPAFPLRFFSEEGQLWDIPDVAYYSDQPPYVNEQRLQEELEELKRLVDHVAREGYNTLVILHLSFEEYVDYKYLDKPVYADDDPHRARSPVFCRYLTDLCNYAHQRHIDVWLQLYELQYPPQLAQHYRVHIDSPDMPKIIQAKCRELFERVPLDGLYVTATEAHPRCGYRSNMIWRATGAPGAAKMINMFTDACHEAGKRVVFRLWRIAGNVSGTKPIIANIRDDAMLSIKNTGGDFFFSSPTTNVITSGLPKEQPFVVIFDVFRQFDGWSRLFCYMKRYAGAVRDCHANGVQGINAWGPWSEGCIWPDWEPGYLRDQEGAPQREKISWAGYWNSYRMYTRGFTPGQANAYLLSRLAWDPEASLAEITHDFCAMHLGKENAAAATEALLATQDAFQEEYFQGIHPTYLKWTMTFHPRLDRMEEAFRKYPLPIMLESNARAMDAINRIEAAFARTDATKTLDEKRYAEFKGGTEKTVLYLRTFYLWREAWWRNRSIQETKGPEAEEDLKRLQQTKAQLLKLFDEWQRFPEEAGFWRITFRYGRPEKGSTIEARTYWYPRGDVTMESTVRAFGQK